MSGSAVDRERTLGWLRDMVRIDSVNPSLVSGARGEAEMARYIAGVCRDMGLEVEVCGPSRERPNVIAVLRGSRPSVANTLLLNGHLDTVGLGSMRRPLEPVEQDGRLYGRGALDMKGGLASILGAIDALARRSGPLEGDVVFVATSDEEYASIGAFDAAASIRAGGAIITEATGLDLGVAHKGFAWMTVRTEGRAAHGSLPSEGIDAIVKMGKFLSSLERHQNVGLRGEEHPLLGYPSIHASTVTGGTELSTYPSSCTLALERRTLPGETREDIVREIEGLLESIASTDSQFKASCEMTLFRDAYEVGRGEAVVQAVSSAFLAVTGRAPGFTGMAAWLDSAVFGAAGIPSVIFGPGGAGLHGEDEYVIVEDVFTVAEVLVSAATEFSG